MDFSYDKYDKGKGKELRGSNIKGGRDHVKSKETYQQRLKKLGAVKATHKKTQYEKNGCYIWGGPHGFRNFPDLKRLKTIVV